MHCATPVIRADVISSRYFEPRHTCMSADSFHHGVEREIKKQPGGGALYDFNDNDNVIEASTGQKVDVYEMQNGVFFSWQHGHSAAKLQKKDRPILANIE